MDREFFGFCANGDLDKAKNLWEKGGIDLGFSYAGNTPLLQAAYKGLTEVAKWLIEIGSPLEAVTGSKQTPLIRAAAGGFTDIVKALLEAGANTEAADKDGKTALAYASERKLADIVSLLSVPEPEPEPEEEKAEYEKEYEEEEDYEEEEIEEEYFEEPVKIASPPVVANDPQKSRTFFDLCNNNKLAEAKTLYAQGGINLGFLVMGNTALIQTVHKGHAEVARWLVEIGSPLDALNMSKQTALFKAVNLFSAELTALLLSNGAKVNDELLLAVSSRHSDLDEQKKVIALLLEHSADPNVSDKRGDDVLINAMEHNLDVIEELVEAGADINRIVKFGYSPLIQAIFKKNTKAALIFIENGADLDHTDDDNKTALHHAAQAALVEVAKALVEKGARTDILDKNENLPLDYAKRCSASKEITALLTVPLSDDEMAAQANSEMLEYAKRNKITDLKSAVWNKHPGLTKHFISLGEDINQWATYGGSWYTMLGIAIYKRDAELVNILVEAGADIYENLKEKTKYADHMEYCLSYRLDDMIKALYELGFDLYRRDYITILVRYCGEEKYIPFFEEVYPMFSDFMPDYGTDEVKEIILNTNSGCCLPLYYFEDVLDNIDDINEQDASGKTLLHHVLINYGRLGIWLEALLNRNDIDVNASDTKDYTPLYYACENASPHAVHQLLLMGADVNETCGNSGKPVILSVFKNDKEWVLEIFERLREFGADVNASDDYGFTSIHAAAKTHNFPLCRLALEYGADPTVADSDGRTPLHFLVEYDSWTGWNASFNPKPKSQDSCKIIELLIEGGADTEAYNNAGQTPLMLAFTKSDTELALIKQLISLGAQIDTQDNQGNTCLHYAVAEGNVNRIRLLLENGVDSSVQNAGGFSAYQLALNENKRSVVSLLEKANVILDIDPDDLDAAFMKACKAGQRGVAEMLLKRGDIDVTYVDDMGRTPLHYVAGLGMNTLASVLIESGVDVNYTERDGKTALHFAASGRHKEIFKLLIDNGADTSIADDNGVLPIHIVSRRGQNDLLAILLEGGADVSSFDDSGRSLLYNACYNRNKECVKMLLENGADANAADSAGNSPLIISVYNNQKEIVKMLLFAGADIRTRDADGDEAIHIAAFNGFKDMLALLLEKGSFIDSLNNAGMSPLHIAALKGYKDIFKWLAERGADLDQTTNSGKSCMDIAVQNGQKELVELIGIIKNRRSV
ncbi:MAG: ankyrin repeat domain-containing protein [Oscillospiraceae bacterium]|nr:ankyrin repeat domain-containing protein [Oscillospiraceae bacterium]